MVYKSVIRSLQTNQLRFKLEIADEEIGECAILSGWYVNISETKYCNEMSKME